MPRKISKAWMLVALIMAGELTCLLAALTLFNVWQSRHLHRVVRQHVLAATRQNAQQMATLIEQMGLHDLADGSDDWARLQNFVERTHLPDEGYLCVINSKTGRMVCHPRLRADPSFSQLSPGHLALRGPAGGRMILELAADGDAASSGWVQLSDDTHLIAVRELPQLGVRLLVHRKEASFSSVAQTFTARVWTMGIVGSVLLVLATGLVTIWIVRRYDNRLATLNESLREMVEERSAALLRSRDAVIFGLAKLAESRDDQTGQHLERICKYVKLLANQVAAHDLDIDDAWVQTVANTAALHDVGKVGIPDSVLLKPGPLTETERQIIQKHPYIGGDTLMAIKRRWGDDPYLVTAGQIVFGHHEKWDGSGYPFGLRGDQIPLSARIVAVADVYDALTSRRPYKDPVSHDAAVATIVKDRDRHFDPRVVGAFVVVEAQFRMISDGTQPLSREEPQMHTDAQG